MIEVYLSFNGNAAEAAAFYQQVFDAPEPYIMRFSDMPREEQEQTPPGAEDLVMYANVKTYAGDIMMSDMMPGTSVTPNEGVWITFSHEDLGRLRRHFDALAKDGEVIMPLEQTFFSKLYGQVKDKFGFYWMIMSPE
ncbi:MAG: VOC family protein [Christensenellales bacterium]|jgi:PhnB protein